VTLIKQLDKTKENSMNRLLVGLLVITAAAVWLLTSSNLHSAPQQKSSAPQFLEGDAYQKARAFSPAVITRGGRIIWLAGQTTTQDVNGKSLLGDFQGQARTVFELMDRTLKRDGASLKNVVNMTVFINDPRNGDQLVKLRQEFFPDGKYPASTMITVSNFAQPGMLIEIEGIAVVPE
jgi:2-iminobutanoate/2-iminopropanoate deaminase